jgi:hypothetical protein
MRNQDAVRYLEERYEAISHRKDPDLGIPCFDDLTQEEREIATGHIMAGESSDVVSEAINEGDSLNLSLLMSRYFIARKPKEFLAALGADVSKRYEKRIDEIFEQIAREESFDMQYNRPYEKDEAYYSALRA